MPRWFHPAEFGTHCSGVRLADLDTLARRQHGLVTRSQSGSSDSAWRRAIVAGNLVLVHRGVARVVGTADTAERRILAAVLCAGQGAMVSHRSAAWLHGSPSIASGSVDIMIPRRGRGGVTAFVAVFPSS